MLNLDTAKVASCLRDLNGAWADLVAADDHLVAAEAADRLRHAGALLSLEAIEVRLDAALKGATEWSSSPEGRPPGR